MAKSGYDGHFTAIISHPISRPWLGRHFTSSQRTAQRWGCFTSPYAPWCWYIYLQNWVIVRANVGKYSSTMGGYYISNYSQRHVEILRLHLHQLRGIKGKPRRKLELKVFHTWISSLRTSHVWRNPSPWWSMTWNHSYSHADRDAKPMKHVSTPFHEERIARPVVDENEKKGVLALIAARVLMKILFAARMARFDLLRAVQGLAARVTKWSYDCDKALHRLVCYIHSTVDVRLEAFIGDPLSKCKLWCFADADHAVEYDNRSTTGCFLLLVGPNTYFPCNQWLGHGQARREAQQTAEELTARHSGGSTSLVAKSREATWHTGEIMNGHKYIDEQVLILVEC